VRTAATWRALATQRRRRGPSGGASSPAGVQSPAVARTLASAQELGGGVSSPAAAREPGGGALHCRCSRTEELSASPAGACDLGGGVHLGPRWRDDSAAGAQRPACGQAQISLFFFLSL
jgi:hypothetical protein